MIKAVWTSSYVLWTTGCGMMLLAGLDYWIDARGHRSAAWIRFSEQLGTNALAAYVLHTLFLGVEAASWAPALPVLLSRVVPEELASLPSILLVLLLSYLPILWLYRRNLFLKV